MKKIDHKCNSCGVTDIVYNCNGDCYKCVLKREIGAVLKRYLLSKNAFSNHPDSLKAFHSNNSDYDRLKEEYRSATADLWEITDREYREDGLHDKMWNWRYAKVMARKCTFLLRGIRGTTRAAKLMRKLDVAEKEFVQAFDLENIYENANERLKRAFPNLCSKVKENINITPAG